MKALVVGYGNPLRRDDGLGPLVARRLAEQARDDLEVIGCHQLTPELAEPISRASLVVFVDARAGAQPGRLACQPLAPARASGARFSHHADPALLLTLARSLYGGCPPAVAVSVDGADFGYGETLTPPVQRAAELAVERVLRLVAAERPPVSGG